MTTQGGFTKEILEGGAELLQKAEFAVDQALAAVELVAGERALMGAMTPEQEESGQQFIAAVTSLADRVTRVAVEMNGQFSVQTLEDNSQLSLGGKNNHALPAGNATDDSQIDKANRDESVHEDENLAQKVLGENSEMEEKFDPSARARQEDVLLDLFGQQHADEITVLPYGVLCKLGEAAASIYENMELHPRAIPTRDERVDQIRRFVGHGESSKDIARDYNLTAGAPKTAVNKAVEIMARDIDDAQLEAIYQGVVGARK